MKAAVEEYFLNSLETECIEVTRELVHPNAMGEVLKVCVCVYVCVRVCVCGWMCVCVYVVGYGWMCVCV